MSRGDSKGFYNNSRRYTPRMADYRLQRGLCERSSKSGKRKCGAVAAAGLVGLLSEGCRREGSATGARAVARDTNPFEAELTAAGYKSVKVDFEVMPGTSYYINDAGDIVAVTRVTNQSEYLARATSRNRAQRAAVATSKEISATEHLPGNTLRDAVERFNVGVQGVKSVKKGDSHTVYTRANVSLEKLPDGRQRYFRETAGITEKVAAAANPAAQGGADPAAQGAANPAAQGAANQAAQGGADPAAQGAADPAAQGAADPAAQGAVVGVAQDPVVIGTSPAGVAYWVLGSVTAGLLGGALLARVFKWGRG